MCDQDHHGGQHRARDVHQRVPVHTPERPLRRLTRRHWRGSGRLAARQRDEGADGRALRRLSAVDCRITDVPNRVRARSAYQEHGEGERAHPLGPLARVHAARDVARAQLARGARRRAGLFALARGRALAAEREPSRTGCVE